jgi:hypothetical protein
MIQERMRREAGEPYARELESLSESDAIERLRSADESRVAEVYHFISRRVGPARLAGVCIELMGRPGRRARLTGAVGLGLCLKATHDIEASRALAIMVRDSTEAIIVRRAAYGSLVLINCGPALPQREPRFEGEQPDPDLDGVDWGFVDSFIPGGNQ